MGPESDGSGDFPSLRGRRGGADRTTVQQHFLVDDELAASFLLGQVVEQVEHQVFDHGPQAAGARVL